MNITIIKELAKLLRDTADKIEAGTCEMNEEQAIEVMQIIAHQPLSKEEASEYLNISRSRFNQLVDEGKLPKGKKRRGFKELVWWKDELKRKQ